MTVRVSFGSGPVGTGLHLLGHDRSRCEPQDAEAWVLLVFFPLFPLGRWCVSVAADGMADQVLELTVHRRVRPSLREALSRMARAVGLAIAILLPFAFAIWMLGTPWATQILSSGLHLVVPPESGGRVGPFLERTVGVAGPVIENLVFLMGTAIPILCLMTLDERTPRVSLMAWWRETSRRTRG